jgi:hypothetical protein
LQEIEDLALSAEVAVDGQMFADSDVFQLVEKLQAVLSEIEQVTMVGDEVTQAQADRVQDLYDQLAVEVELPAIGSLYVGPSRKDMVLEDMGEVGTITITRPAPTEQPRTIHNSLLSQSSRTEAPEVVESRRREDAPRTTPSVCSESTIVEPPVDQVTHASLYKIDPPEIARQKIIEAFEAAELSLLDSWLNEYQSPYKVLGTISFTELRQMVAAPVNSRRYVEFKNLLAIKNVKYEVFNQWSQYFDEMQDVVEQVEHKTFKQVIDEYIATIAKL